MSNDWTFHTLYSEMLNVHFLLLSSFVKALFCHLLCFICYVDCSCISFDPQCFELHSIRIKCFTHEKIGSERYKTELPTF